MIKSFTSKIKSFVFSEGSDSGNVTQSRKRKRDPNDGDERDDDDVVVTSVKKARKLEPQTATLNYLNTLIVNPYQKMAQWFQRKKAWSDQYFFKKAPNGDTNSQGSSQAPNWSRDQTQPISRTQIHASEDGMATAGSRATNGNGRHGYWSGGSRGTREGPLQPDGIPAPPSFSSQRPPPTLTGSLAPVPGVVNKSSAVRKSPMSHASKTSTSVQTDNSEIGPRIKESETVQLNRHDNRSLFSRPPRQKFTALECVRPYEMKKYKQLLQHYTRYSLEKAPHSPEALLSSQLMHYWGALEEEKTKCQQLSELLDRERAALRQLRSKVEELTLESDSKDRQEYMIEKLSRELSTERDRRHAAIVRLSRELSTERDRRLQAENAQELEKVALSNLQQELDLERKNLRSSESDFKARVNQLSTAVELERAKSSDLQGALERERAINDKLRDNLDSERRSLLESTDRENSIFEDMQLELDSERAKVTDLKNSAEREKQRIQSQLTALESQTSALKEELDQERLASRQMKIEIQLQKLDITRLKAEGELLRSEVKSLKDVMNEKERSRDSEKVTERRSQRQLEGERDEQKMKMHLRKDQSLESQVRQGLRLYEGEPPVLEDLQVKVTEEEKEEKFPELTDKMLSVVNDSLRPQPSEEVLVEGYKLKIRRRDMESLAGLNWLNDEIINFYMNQLVERGEQEGRPRVYAFNTFFYPEVMGQGHDSVQRWTRRVDIFSKDYILIPVHLGMHWCLAVIDFKKRMIRYFDSMGGNNVGCLNALKEYLCAESLDKKKQKFDLSDWKTEIAKDIPQQMNGSDCGMFACKFAEYITREADINFTQEHMPYFRKRMVYEIVTKKLLQ